MSLILIGAHPLSSSVHRSLEGTCSRMNIWRRRQTTHEILPIDRHSGTIGSSSLSNTLDCILQNNTKKGHHVTTHLPTSHYRRNIIPSRRDAFKAPGSPILSSRGSSDYTPSATSLWLDEYANSGLQAYLHSNVFVIPDKNDNNRYYTGQMEAEHYLLTPPPPFVFDPFGLGDYSNDSSTLHGDVGMARIPGRDDDPIIPRCIAKQRSPVEPIAPPSSLKVLKEDWIRSWANDVC